MLYLFVSTQFRTQNRFPLLLELLYFACVKKIFIAKTENTPAKV